MAVMSKLLLTLLLPDYLICASLDDIGCEVRQLLEEGVSAPHGLCNHLGKLHGRQGRREPAIAAQDIHAGLDQANSLGEGRGGGGGAG